MTKKWPGDAEPVWRWYGTDDLLWVCEGVREDDEYRDKPESKKENTFAISLAALSVSLSVVNSPNFGETLPLITFIAHMYINIHTINWHHNRNVDIVHSLHDINTLCKNTWKPMILIADNYFDQALPSLSFPSRTPVAVYSPVFSCSSMKIVDFPGN